MGEANRFGLAASAHVKRFSRALDARTSPEAQQMMTGECSWHSNGCSCGEVWQD